MLQQTQVATVIPYYERFLKRFPTVHHLAKAPQDDVLKAWEGLGYYSRARNLHRAAAAIATDHGGSVPDTYDVLAALPGFGPYTTAAVLSIAYDQDHAVVDGNVIRVLSRLFDLNQDVTLPATRVSLQTLAQRLLPPGQAGSYNQAVMELGALVCTPRTPQCTDCPVATVCKARRRGTVGQRPVKPPRTITPHYTYAVGIVYKKGRLLIAKRPQKGLLGGLWEFPAARRNGNESLKACCLRGIEETAGVSASIKQRGSTVRHAYSHFRVTMHAFHCMHESGRARAAACEEVRWATPAEIDALAFSRANRKLIDSLKQADLLGFSATGSE
jgi:A/G-specific adenine glycosylase